MTELAPYHTLFYKDTCFSSLLFSSLLFSSLLFSSLLFSSLLFSSLLFSSLLFWQNKLRQMLWHINLSDYLSDPLSLAVWYCDDGTLRKDCNASRIATQAIAYSRLRVPKHGRGSRRGIESWKSSSNILYYSLCIPDILGLYERLRSSMRLSRKEVPTMLYKLERPRND
uniref:Putative LAGLIDADG homing endonuclease n=1 Tax=Closterium baillyanum TaxID=1416941 RepID=U5YGR1_9VIRI|nr:putative LAGLIDADG homing endonuclease [Closterium baillyanum]AGZ90271.1 putative LAGLIDADG homing endonuclease [Closterium baillyanum]